MKIWRLVIILVVVGFLSFGIYSLYNDTKIYMSEESELQKKTDELKKEQETLKQKIDYYAHQENLLKEARTQFNLKKPEENLIIIVPSLHETSTASSTGE